MPSDRLFEPSDSWHSCGAAHHRKAADQRRCSARRDHPDVTKVAVKLGFRSTHMGMCVGVRAQRALPRRVYLPDLA